MIHAIWRRHSTEGDSRKPVSGAAPLRAQAGVLWRTHVGKIGDAAQGWGDACTCNWQDQLMSEGLSWRMTDVLLRSVKCDNLSPPPLIHAGTDHPGEDTGCIFLSRKERAGGGGQRLSVALNFFFQRWRKPGFLQDKVRGCHWTVRGIDVCKWLKTLRF